MFNKENDHFWTVEFYRSNSQGVTGEGDSQRIFATVLGAIKKFVKKYQPRYIVFSAVKEDDPTGRRASLYERMVQKYARQLGYEIEVLDEGYRTTYTLYQSGSLNEQDVAEEKNNDIAITLTRLGRFHKGQDTLAEFVPERARARYALHPEKWESTFFSLTNKDPRKLKYFGPKEISIPPGTLVGDMAIANRFYRAETAEEKQKYAEAYRQSLKPYPVDVSQYRMPELLIPQQGVTEGSEQKMSIKDTLAYLQKVMGTESHEDWRNDIINNNDYFVLKDIPLNSLWIDLPMLDKSNVEKYKQMDFSKAPSIVISSNGNIIDGYHRANVAKALNIPTLKAWVGVKKQGVTEGTNNITYKQQKGKNKFSIEMSVDGKSAGIFQYDADTGRTLVELDPALRGQGLGQRLILKGIYTAAMLGMNYVEDESRTQMFDRALDSLADAGYIVNDDEYWYVTSSGEQFLKQRVAEGVGSQVVIK
jgi:GNAT superfamily N-acetyltransferase